MTNIYIIAYIFNILILIFLKFKFKIVNWILPFSLTRDFKDLDIFNIISNI